MMPATATAASEDAATDLRVETVSDFQSFLELGSVWNRLVEETGIPHPFLSHDWLRAWWEHFGAGKALHILVVKAGGDAIAIAPMMRSVERMYGVNVRRLGSISNDHTPRFDVIIARQPGQAWRAIWRSLISQRQVWDVLVLGQLPSGSPTIEALTRCAEDDGFLTGLWRSSDSPYVPLGGTWEGYLRGLGSKHRSNLRNRLKRLGGLGQVGLEVISSGHQLEAALQEGARIEAAAWKGEAGTAMLSRPDVYGFYTRLARTAAQRGWLRLTFLTVDHRRIAFAYNLCHQGKLFVLKDGYDPGYARFSPFNLLCHETLRDAYGRGLVEYDLLGDTEEWKREWAKAARTHYWLYVFPNAFPLRLLHHLKFRLIPRLRQHRLHPVFQRTILALKGIRAGSLYRFNGRRREMEKHGRHSDHGQKNHGEGQWESYGDNVDASRPR